MIGYLDGTVAGRTTDGCFLDVAGVGYRILCSGNTAKALPPDGERVKLWVHTHVREDALALFGFISSAEQTMFEGLIGVSSVGPKVALALCSAFSPEQFRRALVTDDIGVISSVPGIGKKTAQRILLDLKEKLELPDLAIVGSQPDMLAQARSALENLGYSSGEVRAALGEVAPDDDAAVADVIKSALRVLAS